MTPWKTASAFLALLVASPLALAMPELDVRAGPRGGGPGGRPGGRHGKTHTFGPGRRPGVDRKNFRKHLAPKEQVSLFYAGADASDPGTIDMQLTMNTPAVVLEDVEAITGVQCDASGDSLTVSFSNQAAFSTALEDWDIGSPVILITDENTPCTPDLERGYFVVGGVTSDFAGLSITVSARKEKLEGLAAEMEMSFNSLPAATINKRLTLDPSTAINWAKSLPRTSIFKNTYLDIAAESAGFSTTLTFSGHLKFSFLTFELKDLYFDVAAQFDSSAVLSATLAASYTKSITYAPDALSWSVVNVPGVVSLGPGVAFGLQLDFSASGSASVTAGVGFAIPAGLIHIDIKNSSLSYVSGWKPTYTAYANLAQSAVVKADVAANLKVEMAFTLLGGVIDLSSGINAAPGIANTFTLRGQQSISPTGVLVPTSTTCTTALNGVQLISDFFFSIKAYSGTYWSKELYRTQKTIFNKCYKFA